MKFIAALILALTTTVVVVPAAAVSTCTGETALPWSVLASLFLHRIDHLTRNHSYLCVIRQVGTRKTIQGPATELVLPAAAHHRQLAVMEKYSVVGNGANLEAYWTEGTCDYGSYFSLDAADSVYKYQSNGKPTTTPSKYAWGYMEKWLNCTETEVTHTYAWIDFYGEAMDFSVGQKLGMATLDASTDVFAVTETCTQICDPDWGCYYGNCITVNNGYVPTILTVSWNATGVASTSSWMSKNSGPGYSMRSSSKGKTRPASVTVSLSLDGTNIEIPADWIYGHISQTTSGDVYKYKN